MSKIDKEHIVIILAIFGLVGISVLFSFVTKEIPWWLLVSVVTVVQIFVIDPLLCRDYYKLNKAKAGWWRFIPLVNELQMFSMGSAIAAAAGTILSAVILAASFLFTDLVGNIFGIQAGMFWANNCIAVFIICVVITNFIYAFGLCGVMRNVNVMAFEMLHMTTSKAEYIYYILMMVPFVRICSLITLWDKVKLLTVAASTNGGELKFTKQGVTQ